MYNLKKVIASICVIAMMLTTVAFGATYSDVAEDSAYYEAVETLNKLDIVTGYEDGTYKPEDGVTRAEMATLIARIQGYGDTAAGSANTGFADVPASHWASGYIANAAGMGIVNGYGNGNFGPEDSVLYEQAVKMIMATLGYTPYADHNGGYPGGYLAAAQRYEVTNGVANATMGTEANRGTIAQLLANAIDTPLMAQERWSTSGDVEYAIYDGKLAGYPLKTLMSENLGYVKIRGVVTENAYTDIYDEGNKTIDTTVEETIVINVLDAFDTANKDFTFDEDGDYTGDVDTFLVGETDAADFIGKSVIAYVKKVDSDYEIVSIVADTTRNDVIEMDLTQFSKLSDSNKKLEYFKTATAKTATAVTVNGAKVVFNNVGGYDVDDIFGVEVLANGATKNGGKITMIDNDTTKGYDVIFVEIAETAVVDEAEDGYISFKEETSVTGLTELVVDEDDEETIISITKDGEEVAVDDLAEWDVLSIIANASGTYVIAEVISNSVVGTITSVTKSAASATGSAYKVGNDKYDVAEGAYGLSDIAIGAGGTFYIDKYGKIAAFNEDAALASGVSANYAYVTAVAFDEDVLTGKDTAIVQMITADGVLALNVKATNAKLHDDATTITIDVDNADHQTALSALVGQVVKYTKDSANLITAITTADADTEKFYAVTVDDADQAYDAENGKFDDFYLDADAIVFFIDEVKDLGEDGEEGGEGENADTWVFGEATDCYLGAVADLEDETSYAILGLYADNKADDNNILVVRGGTGSVSPKSGMGVLTAVGSSENEDGEAIYSVEVMINGETITADTTADVALGFDDGDLTEGDIVKVKVGSDGIISALELVWDFADGVRNFGTLAEAGSALAGYNVAATKVASDTAKEKFVGGQVASYKKSSTLATIGEDTIKLSQAKNVYVIDANGRNLEIKEVGSSNFKAYDSLYKEGLANVKVTIGKNDQFTATQAQAKNAADYVYARVYDGKVVDLVIVKGVADLRVVDGAAAVVE